MVQVSKTAHGRPARSIIENQHAAVMHSTIVKEIFPYVIACILVMHFCYIALLFTYQNSTHLLFGTLHLPSEEYCRDQLEYKNNEKCGRPDLFAFQIVSGILFLIVGSLGLYGWYVPPRAPSFSGTVNTQNGFNQKEDRSMDDSEIRLFGHQKVAQWLTILNFSYQLWDFVVSLFIPEHRTVIMLTHHAAAAVVCLSGIYNYMMGYYAIFFLGLSEVSSIFLVSLDLSKYFQPSQEELSQPTILTTYTTQYAGPLFVVTFVYFRVLLWWPISKQMFDDIRNVIRSGRAEQLRPGRTYILYIWIALNLPMGILQLYFLSLIFKEARAVVEAAM
jgi:TLC domain